MIFIQLYASAVGVECLALSLSTLLIIVAFAQLLLPHAGLSLAHVCTVARFPCLAMVSELFWKYSRIYMFTTSSKTTLNLIIKSDYKSVFTCSQLDHAHNVLMQHTYAYTGHTHNIYIYIYEKFHHSTHWCGARSRLPQ